MTSMRLKKPLRNDENVKKRRISKRKKKKGLEKDRSKQSSLSSTLNRAD